MSDVPQVNPVVEQVADKVGEAVVTEVQAVEPKAVVKFFDSALGKSVQTLLWTAAAFALTAVGGWVANVHFSSGLVALGVPGLINWVLYSLKVVADKEVPNLPSN